MNARISSSFLALACAALFVFAACSPSTSPEQKLVGTWGFSAEQSLALMGDAVAEEEAAAVTAALEAMTLNITFGADGTVSTDMGAAEARTATYTAAANEDGTLTLTVTEEGDEDADVSTVTFVSDDVMHMTMRNDEFAFVRQ